MVCLWSAPLGRDTELRGLSPFAEKSLYGEGLVLENRSRPAKRRQALLESNLPRNSRLELIEADEHWE